MKTERELILSTLVLEECLINKPKENISKREMGFINNAFNAFNNLDFFTTKEIGRDFNTSFDNKSFPTVVDALFKYERKTGQDAINVLKSIINVIYEYINNALDKDKDDYSKTIDFLKTVNSIYRQKISNNLSSTSYKQYE